MAKKHKHEKTAQPPEPITKGKGFKLKDQETVWLRESGDAAQLEESKTAAEVTLRETVESLTKAQELLSAVGTYGVLIILQGMDAAGKDGTIKHVMSGVNPQACSVHSFKEPSPEELKHSFLWRYMKAMPERGKIGIFNRSHYEDVVTQRVHPEWLEKQGLKASSELWQQRFEDIKAFEQHLLRSNILVLKLFLHISKKEQKARLLARLDEKSKLWKFSMADVSERDYWRTYQDYYEEAIAETATPWAPWYIIPADQKWAARSLVAEIVTGAISGLGLKVPPVDASTKRMAEAARRKLSKA